MTVTIGSTSLTPDLISRWLVQPMWAGSVVGRILEPEFTDAHAGSIICPGVEISGSDWVAEASEIPLTEATYSEVSAPLCKVAGLSQVSREFVRHAAAKSGEEGVGNVLSALTGDLAAKIDAAFLTDVHASKSLAPAGVRTAGVTTVEGVTDFADAIVDADANARVLTGQGLAGVIASVDVLSALAKTKVQAGAAEPAYTFAGDALTVNGVKVIASRALGEGEAVALPVAGVVVGGRPSGELDMSEDYAFNRDVVTYRAIAHVGFAFSVPKAVTLMFA